MATADALRRPAGRGRSRTPSASPSAPLTSGSGLGGPAAFDYSVALEGLNFFGAELREAVEAADRRRPSGRPTTEDAGRTPFDEVDDLPALLDVLDEPGPRPEA